MAGAPLNDVSGLRATLRFSISTYHLGLVNFK